MTIEVGNFRIKSSSSGLKKFDLFKMHKIEKGKNAGKELEKDEAWGVSLERCFEIMAHDETFSLSGTLDLEMYLDRYNEITNKLIKEVNKMK